MRRAGTPTSRLLAAAPEGAGRARARRRRTGGPLRRVSGPVVLESLDAPRRKRPPSRRGRRPSSVLVHCARIPPCSTTRTRGREAITARSWAARNPDARGCGRAISSAPTRCFAAAAGRQLAEAATSSPGSDTGPRQSAATIGHLSTGSVAGRSSRMAFKSAARLSATSIPDEMAIRRHVESGVAQGGGRGPASRRSTARRWSRSSC